MEIKFNIFLSHDSKDEVIALELKTFLENIFLNSNVYVSGRDLRGGQTWIENIKISLKTSQVIIPIITKESINTNWLYFEAGAGFTEDKSIPLLTDNLKFSDLTPPFSLLQTRMLSKEGITSLVNDIATNLNLRAPKNLMGIDKLLEETNKFIQLRNKEEKSTELNTPIEKTFVKPHLQSTNLQGHEVDTEIFSKNNQAINRTTALIKRKVLSLKDTLEIPPESEFTNCDLSQMQTLARAYNIPAPDQAILNLIMNNLNLPGKDSKQWEKMNALKAIESSNQILDQYEKTI